ncbi:hypothetical protein OPU71_02395 [Niveibacterium sp. 24ML]|uniref:hypothetical protein n=1 Tax=Niveibacterium sp. 24ML TaxID=2985512 RepID=UPI00226FAC4A|nr:hypothetical protein [Niveibacterium sp. 24ML]MCX9154970.1 hypothetical protein [Niveibacterium sp. 24ML]
MSTLLATRPYLRESVASLRCKFEQNGANLSVLAQLLLELNIRTKPAALQLRAEVAQRLLEVAQEYYYFPWPSTEAPGGNGQLDESHFPYKHGMLGWLGYRVGKAGLEANRRHGLLDSAYANDLPGINSQQYFDEWGTARSAVRLQKMAQSIAAFARHKKRAGRHRYAAAISDWETDLAYLKASHYIGRYDFPWPQTDS